MGKKIGDFTAVENFRYCITSKGKAIIEFPFSLPCSLYPRNDLLFEDTKQTSTHILNNLFACFT